MPMLTILLILLSFGSQGQAYDHWATSVQCHAQEALSTQAPYKDFTEIFLNEKWLSKKPAYTRPSRITRRAIIDENTFVVGNPSKNQIRINHGEEPLIVYKPFSKLLDGNHSFLMHISSSKQNANYIIETDVRSIYAAAEKYGKNRDGWTYKIARNPILSSLNQTALLYRYGDEVVVSLPESSQTFRFKMPENGFYIAGASGRLEGTRYDGKIALGYSFFKHAMKLMSAPDTWLLYCESTIDIYSGRYWPPLFQ